MNNPYLPPNSEILSPSADKPSGFWKFYFWFHVVVTPLLAIGLAMANSLNPFDFIDLFMFALILVGLYGFTYRKALFGHKFWRIMVFVLPIWSLLYEVVLPLGFGILNYGEPFSLGPILAFSLFMTTLTMLAFYRYSSHSSPVWLAS